MTTCPRCHGTHQLPFYRKDGTVSNSAIICCDCKEDAPMRDSPLADSDFDFPCSFTWRAYYHEQATGEVLPALEPRELPSVKKIPQYVPSGELENIKGALKYVQAKVTQKEKKDDYY